MTRAKKLSIIVAVFICYFITFIYSEIGGVYSSETEKIKENIMNKIQKETIIEGDFIDRNSRKIIENIGIYKSKTIYPEAYSYIIGYNSEIYSASALRKSFQSHLYDDNGIGKGGSIKLTTDNVLQNKAYKELKNNGIDGSIIILDRKTSEILAMASRKKQDFNIEDIEENYAEYSEIDGFFLNPALSNRYAPGSVFKIITSLCALENGMDDFEYTDSGTFEVENSVINNYANAVYGKTDLKNAFCKSINTYFAALALKEGETRLLDTARACLIGQDIYTELAALKSGISPDGSDFMLSQIGFGQGNLYMTPLHIAMIGQALNNEGIMLKPYIVKELINSDGRKVYSGKEEKITRIADAKYCKKIVEIMQYTANMNFPELVDISKTVGVKTGTAELGNGYNHSSILAIDDKYVILVSINDTLNTGGYYKNILEVLLKELYY